MIPSLRDGLHCGDAIIQRLIVHDGVIPSLRDGLHCGTTGSADEHANEES